MILFILVKSLIPTKKKLCKTTDKQNNLEKVKKQISKVILLLGTIQKLCYNYKSKQIIVSYLIMRLYKCDTLKIK